MNRTLRKVKKIATPITKSSVSPKAPSSNITHNNMAVGTRREPSVIIVRPFLLACIDQINPPKKIYTPSVSPAPAGLMMLKRLNTSTNTKSIMTLDQNLWFFTHCPTPRFFTSGGCNCCCVGQLSCNPQFPQNLIPKATGAPQLEH